MKPILYRSYNPLQKWVEAPLIFLIGGVGYSALEMLWRGYTHPAMAICGAYCFYFIYRVCARHPYLSIVVRAALGATFITLTELFVGCLLNIALGLNVWDYSQLPYQFLGQISLHYSIIWFFLSIVLCGLSGIIRRKVFCSYV